MSIQAVGWALEQDIRVSGAKLILVALANHADHTTGHCWPSVRLLAREGSMSMRSVHRHLRYLEDRGFIRVEGSREQKHGRASTYWVNCNSGATVVTSAKMAHGAALRRTVGTPGSATVGRTKNHQMNRKYHTACLQPGARPQGLAIEKQQDRGSIELSIANRIGENGWVILMALPTSTVEYLVSRERRGTLDEEAIAQLRAGSLSLS
jgi:hypothetical protein